MESDLSSISKEVIPVNPETAWLFDVDGVLTSPEEKKVTEPEIFNELIKRLKKDEPVGLNTGRSLDFMINEILIPLEKIIDDRKKLKNIAAVGEKGGAWIVYDENGNRETKIDENVSVPQEIQDKVRELVNKPQYSETVFYDETKRTIVTVELKVGKTVAQFSKPQQELAKEMKDLLVDHLLDDEYRVDTTRIAIDLENKKMGKALGARKYVELLNNMGVKPKKFICFGDSVSDYDMQSELKRMGKNSEFVFVGGKEHLSEKGYRDVEYTEELVDKGTLKYLQAN